MKVGDYVRAEISSLNLQRIGKIKEIISEYFIHTDIGTYDKENIIKSSPNIIDLIEVGDFIGKTIVEEVLEFDDGTRVIVMADGFDEYDENEDFLKAGIVTKEQFESMKYKVGE